MIDHIYGKYDLLTGISRPNLFIKEFGLYIDYLKKEIDTIQGDVKKAKYVGKFYNQLQNGIAYYGELLEKSDKALQMWNAEQVKKLDQYIANLSSIGTAYINSASLINKL